MRPSQKVRPFSFLNYYLRFGFGEMARAARPPPPSAIANLLASFIISRGTANLPGGVTKGQARSAQRPRKQRPSAFNRPRRATPGLFASFISRGILR